MINIVEMIEDIEAEGFTRTEAIQKAKEIYARKKERNVKEEC